MIIKSIKTLIEKNQQIVQEQIENVEAIGSGIKSVQRGTCDGSATITINEVDPEKTVVLTTGFTTLKGAGKAYYYGYYGGTGGGGRATLVDSTTLKIEAYNGYTHTGWEVIEYV